MEGRMGVPEEEPMVDTAVTMDEGDDHCCQEAKNQLIEMVQRRGGNLGPYPAEEVVRMIQDLDCQTFAEWLEFPEVIDAPGAKAIRDTWDRCAEENNMLERSNDSFEDAWIMAKSTEFPETIVTLYSGMGGVEQGAKMAGLPTAYSGDAWADAMKVRDANHPEGYHEHVEFGADEWGSIPAVAKRILTQVGNRKYHLHGSPPCQAHSKANRQANLYTGAKEGMEQIRWFHDLWMHLMDSPNPPVSWTMEEVSEARDPISHDDHLSDTFRRLAAETPDVFASDHGVPQRRGRLIMGQHGDKDILIRPSVDKPLELGEVFPEAMDRFVANTDRRNRFIDQALRQNPELTDDPNFIEYLRNTPMINQGDAIKPGWRTANYLGGEFSHGFNHLYPLLSGLGAEYGIRGPQHGGISSSMTSKRPTWPYDRKFTREEQKRMMGFPEDYETDVGEGRTRVLSDTSGRWRWVDNVDLGLGNAVVPPVFAAMFRQMGDDA